MLVDSVIRCTTPYLRPAPSSRTCNFKGTLTRVFLPLNSPSKAKFCPLIQFLNQFKYDFTFVEIICFEGEPVIHEVNSGQIF
jgi:hypothetical protein